VSPPEQAEPASAASAVIARAITGRV
jgi:hypothetical protein